MLAGSAQALDYRRNRLCRTLCVLYAMRARAFNDDRVYLYRLRSLRGMVG